jgi:hypothetical protein
VTAVLPAATRAAPDRSTPRHAPVPGFADAADHLLAELSRLDVELELLILTRHRAGRLAGDPDYRGLYIPDGVLAGLLRPPDLSGDTDLATAREAAAQARHQVAARLAATPGAAALPLPRLAANFGLSSFEQDVLLLTVAPEVDVRYRALLGWLQDDATLRHPTLALALDLWGGDAHARLGLVAALARGATLTDSGLVTLAGADGTPLPSREFRTDARLVAHVLGDDTLDPRLRGCAEVLATAGTPAALDRSKAVTTALTALAADLAGGGVAVIHGAPGSGRTTAATAVAAATWRPVLRVDHRADAALLPAAVREARLRGAALVLRHADHGAADARLTDLLAATATMRSAGLPVLLTADSPWHRQAQGTGEWRDLELGELDYASRRRVWFSALQQAGVPTDDAIVAEVAGTFHLGPGRIEAAALRAHELLDADDALSSPASNKSPTSNTLRGALRAAARAHSADRLSGLARRIESGHSWPDLVLGGRSRRQLEEVLGAARHRTRVREEYGFTEERGLHVLFAGPSGTGKTMAAGLVAAELGVDLYAVDLAATVSKYLGETEKNLDRVFAEGRAANAMLLFDEADALFGRRSEVKDAHDRYANVEVAFLLQRMEAYDGVTVLATNLYGNLDPAFARRLRYVVEFAAPGPELRAEIWRRALPEALPRGSNLDTDFLAAHVELTGAGIRGAAHAAALLAAARGEPVGMADLVRAVARELEKVGRAPTRAEFGPWWEVLAAQAEESAEEAGQGAPAPPTDIFDADDALTSGTSSMSVGGGG